MPYDEVMHKFKKGKLKSSNGGKVTSRKQAIAIMMSEKRAAEGGKEEYMPKHGKKEMKSNMPKGAAQSPSGDIGAKRQEESTKMGGFKAGSTVTTAGKF